MYKRVLKNVRTIEEENKFELDNEEIEQKQIQQLRQLEKELNAVEASKQKSRSQKQEYFCNQCNQSIKYTQFALDQHLNSIEHQKKAQEFKIRFKKYIKKQKKILLSRKADPSKKLKKLIFFRRVYNFE